jgi:hypothetical protein
MVVRMLTRSAIHFLTCIGLSAAATRALLTPGTLAVLPLAR